MKKIKQKKKHKKSSAYGDIYHQGVIQSELSAVSCLAYYFSHINVWELMKLNFFALLIFY